MFELRLRVGDNYEIVGHAQTYEQAVELKEQAMKLQKIDDSVAGRIEVWDNREFATSDIEDVYRDMQIAVHGEWYYETIEEYMEDGE